MTDPRLEVAWVLEPCPFCKSQNITIGYDGQPARRIYFMCSDCKATGPAQEFYQGMTVDVSLWNRHTLKAIDEMGSYVSPGNPSVVSVPSTGWKLVPIEPTPEMLRAAFIDMNKTPGGTWKRLKEEGLSPRALFDTKMTPRYRAMLSAAPLHPLQGEE